MERIHKTCVSLFFIVIVMIIAGQYYGNEKVTSVAVGMGIAVCVIEMIISVDKEDEENEI